MKKILYVCTGNICRSAMAHSYMQKKLNEQKNSDILVDSCGINACCGQQATNNSKQAMVKYNVDLSNHRSKKIQDVSIFDYDLILALTTEHKEEIIAMYPGIKNKVHVLKELVFNDYDYLDIDDPWGYDINVYDKCAEQIVKCVDKLMKNLKGSE